MCISMLKLIGKRSSILCFAFVCFLFFFHLYLLQIESVLPHVDPIANEVLIQRTLIHNIVSIHGSGVMAEDHCT